MKLLLHSLQQSLILLPLVLGIYISYGCAKLTDLTIEGSFIFGSAIYAGSLVLTNCPFLSFVLGSLSGIIPGILTGTIQFKNRMDSLMAGIITLFILQSGNIFVLGKPNINLLDYAHTFTHTVDLIGLGIALLVGIMIIDRSMLGLKFKALGSNPALFKERYSLDGYRILVLSLGNMLAAMSGVLMTSVNEYADIYMGQGVAIIGIGTFILGRELHRHLAFGVIGLMIYFVITHMLLFFGIDTLIMKLMIGIFLALILGGRHALR